jgi:hypothetical protein
VVVALWCNGSDFLIFSLTGGMTVDSFLGIEWNISMAQ